MTRTQATINYLEAERQAQEARGEAVKPHAEAYLAAMKQAKEAVKPAKEAYDAAILQTLAVCETALDQAWEDYEAAKKQEGGTPDV